MSSIFVQVFFDVKDGTEEAVETLVLLNSMMGIQEQGKTKGIKFYLNPAMTGETERDRIFSTVVPLTWGCVSDPYHQGEHQML